MSSQNSPDKSTTFTFSLDSWAVLVALVLALAVRFESVQEDSVVTGG